MVKISRLWGGPGGNTLPTWVPRWDAGRLDHIIGHPGKFHASGSRPSGVTRASFEDNFNALVVQGLIVDVIGRRRPPFTKHDFVKLPMTKYTLFDTWTFCQDANRPVPFTIRTVYQPVPNVPALQAFLATLAPVGLFLHHEDQSAYYSGIAALGQIYPPITRTESPPREAQPVCGFNTDEKDPLRLLLKVLAEGGEESGVNPSFGLTPWKTTFVGRCFAVSSKGWFSLVPPRTRPNDLLCLLAGGETAYVLRPIMRSSNPCHFSFIGEAYVHGLMEDGIGMFNLRKGMSEFRIR